MGAKAHEPVKHLDLSLPPSLRADGGAGMGVDQPYGNAAAAEQLAADQVDAKLEPSLLRGFDLPDGQSCFGVEVGGGAAVGVCGGVDPDLDPARPDDPNQKKGVRAGLGVDFRF